MCEECFLSKARKAFVLVFPSSSSFPTRARLVCCQYFLFLSFICFCLRLQQRHCTCACLCHLCVPSPFAGLLFKCQIQRRCPWRCVRGPRTCFLSVRRLFFLRSVKLDPFRAACSVDVCTQGRIFCACNCTALMQESIC